jgi:hypothetical protein
MQTGNQQQESTMNTTTIANQEVFKTNLGTNRTVVESETYPGTIAFNLPKNERKAQVAANFIRMFWNVGYTACQIEKTVDGVELVRV